MNRWIPIIIASALVFCICVCILALVSVERASAWRQNVPPTIQEFMKRLKGVGGVEAINSEATSMFEFFETNRRSLYLPTEQQSRFPKLAPLGGSHQVVRGSNGVPEVIRVRFGTHWDVKWLFIFNPASEVCTQ